MHRLHTQAVVPRKVRSRLFVFLEVAEEAATQREKEEQERRELLLPEPSAPAVTESVSYFFSEQVQK